MSLPLSKPAGRDTAYALVAVPGADTLASPPSAPPAPSLRRRFADGLYILLVSTGWLSLNLLAVAGCAVAAFAILGGGDWQSTFMQIDNLTSRYLDADAGRRAAFQHHMVQLFSTLTLALVVFRLPAFVKRVRRDLAETDSQ